MTIALIYGLVVIVVICIVVSIFVIIEGFPSSNYQIIKFDNFKNLYAINPDRWELYNKTVSFVKPRDEWLSWKQTVTFQFSLTDYYRYKHWKKNLEKQKQREKECKQLQEVISILKSDLEKFENKNAKNMDAAAKHSIELCGKIKDKNITVQDIQEYLKQAGYNVVINPVEMFPGPETRREIKVEEIVDKLWDI